LNGHRQQFTQVQIEDILIGGKKTSTRAKKASTKAVAENVDENTVDEGATE